MKLIRNSITVIFALVLTCSFNTIKKPKFKKLTVYASKGCATGYDIIIDDSKPSKGIYKFTYANCGGKKNDSFYTISFPEEVKVIINDLEQYLSKNTIGESMIAIGRYKASMKMTDSLNYHYTINK